MASSSSSSSILPLVALGVAFLSLLSPCTAGPQYSKSFNFSDVSLNWGPASATWYGSPTGAGADDNGGGCGYKNVNMPPFNSMTSCGNTFLFRGGEGCGSCYKVKCHSHPACSGDPSTLIITDVCEYGICADEPVHFDMSGTTFGSMALPGRDDELRHAGRLPIQYVRVPCEYPGRNVAFHVDVGSNPVYFATLIEYEDGDGDLSSVTLMEANGRWSPMRESWGAIWRLDADHALQAPFTIKMTTLKSDRTLVAHNVIPATWKPNSVYRSIVNYST